LFTSNLTGPARPAYLAGARMLEAFQIGVIQGNVTLAVGVLSYAGRLGVDIVGDTPAEFGAYIKSEIPKWTAIVKASGATMGH
ncbi:MAG TPA: WS/DGAT domain-containing protein, partial [Pseudolabrys sp.]